MKMENVKCEIKEEKKEDGDTLSYAIDANSHLHIFCRQQSVILANKRFVEELTKISMRTSETAIQDTSKGSFRVTTIGGSMLRAVLGHKFQ